MPEGPGLGLGEVFASIGVKLDNLLKGVEQAKQVLAQADKEFQKAGAQMGTAFTVAGQAAQASMAAAQTGVATAVGQMAGSVAAAGGAIQLTFDQVSTAPKQLSLSLGEVATAATATAQSVAAASTAVQASVTQVNTQAAATPTLWQRIAAGVNAALEVIRAGLVRGSLAVQQWQRSFVQSTQNADKAVSSLGNTIQKVFVAAITTAAIKRFAAALNELANTAFRAETGMLIFAKQVQKTGQDINQAMADIQRLSDRLRVPQEVLAQNASELIRYGYSVEQIVSIFEGAVASGLLVGRTTVESINYVTEALISERSVMLNIIGIVENLDASLRNYARTQGVAVDNLTRAQRAEANYQMILRATRSEVEELDVLLSAYGGAVAELGMQQYNYRRAVGQAFLPTVTQVTWSLSELFSVMARIAQTREFRNAMAEIGRVIARIVVAITDFVEWLGRYRRAVLAIARIAIPAFAAAIGTQLIPKLLELGRVLNTTIGRYTALFFAIIAAGAALYQMGQGLLEGKSLMESIKAVWEDFVKLFQEGPLALFQPEEPPDVGPSIPGIDTTVEDLAGRIAEKFETWDENLQKVRLSTGDVTTELEAQERFLNNLLEALKSGEAAFEKAGFADLILGTGEITEESIRLLYARSEILDVERQIAELAARQAASQDAREQAILADQIAELQAKRAEMLAQNQQVEMLATERLLDVQDQLNHSAEYALELAKQLNQEIEEGRRSRLSDFQQQIAEIDAWQRQATGAVWALTDEQAKAMASLVVGTTGIPLEQLLADPLRIRQELVNQVEEEGRARRTAAEIEHNEEMAELALQNAIDLAERRDLIEGESLERRRQILDELLALMEAHGWKETEAFRQAELEKLRVERQILDERERLEAESNERIRETAHRINLRRNREDRDLDANTRKFLEEQAEASAERIRETAHRINLRRNREDRDLDANTRKFLEEQARETARRVEAAWSRTWRSVAETIGGPVAQAVQTFTDAWAEFDVTAKLREALPWLRELEQALARGAGAVGQWLSGVAGDVGATIRRASEDRGIGSTVARGLLMLGDVATQVAGALGLMLGPLLALAVMLAQASPQFQQLTAALEPLFTQLAALFGMLIQPLIPLVDVLANALGPLFQSLAPLFATLAQILASGLSVGLQMLGQVFQFLRPILDAFVWFLQKFIIPVFNVLGELLEGLWNGLAVIVNAIIDAINFLYPFGDLIKTRMGKVRFDPIDTGTLPAPGTGGTPETGTGNAGTQISQITGPTRDLLVEMYRPLLVLSDLPQLFVDLKNVAQQALDALLAALSGSADGLAMAGGLLEIQEARMTILRGVINVDTVESLQVAGAQKVTIVDRSGRAVMPWLPGLRTVGA